IVPRPISRSRRYLPPKISPSQIELGKPRFTATGSFIGRDTTTAMGHPHAAKVLPPRLRPPSPPWLRPAGANLAHPRETPGKMAMPIPPSEEGERSSRPLILVVARGKVRALSKAR